MVGVLQPGVTEVVATEAGAEAAIESLFEINLAHGQGAELEVQHVGRQGDEDGVQVELLGRAPAEARPHVAPIAQRSPRRADERQQQHGQP